MRTFSPSRSGRSMRSRALLFVAAGSLGLAACGQNDATREDMINALTEEAEMTEDQANCVADIIYAEGAWTQDELNSAGSDPSSVAGFQDALDEALAGCV